MALKAFYIIAMVITMVALGASLITRRSELTKRCLTLIVLINLMCFILLLGRAAFILSMLTIAIAGSYELSLCAKMNRFETVLLIITGVSLFTVIKLYGVLFYCLLPFGLVMSFLLLWPKFIFKKLNCIAWGSLISIVIPCSVALTKIYDLDTNHIIAIILLVQFNDGFSYLVGQKLGKTKLSFINPISPNKTLEGYIGGMLGVILAIMLLQTVIPVYADNKIFIRFIFLTISVFIFSNAGDLVFSIIKRKFKVKDFSNILAGHGGILDRFDSILYLAPIYILLIYEGVI